MFTLLNISKQYNYLNNKIDSYSNFVLFVNNTKV